MKKHLIAAAVAAAVAVPAAAQVTVYGLIDAGYAVSDIDHGTAATTKQKVVGGLHSANGTGTLSGSRLGFRGTEDLGGGLKAGFVYEFGINYSPGQAATTTATGDDATNLNANGAGIGNVRQGFFELGGGFGSVRIGTQNTLAKDSTEAFEPLAGATITGAASIYQAGLVTRRDSFTYQTPAMSGFSARFQVYIGESTTNSAIGADNKGNALSIAYAGGPLRAMAIGERISKQTYYGTSSNRLVSLESGSVALPISAGGTATTANIIDKVDFNAFGASYNLGVATISGMVTELKYKDATAADNGGELESTIIGVTVPLGSLSLRASMTQGKISNATAKTYDTDGYQLQAQYDLSKRTHAYFAMGNSKFDSPTANSDAEIKQTGIGLRHTF